MTFLAQPGFLAATNPGRYLAPDLLVVTGGDYRILATEVRWAGPQSLARRPHPTRARHPHPTLSPYSSHSGSASSHSGSASSSSSSSSLTFSLVTEGPLREDLMLSDLSLCQLADKPVMGMGKWHSPFRCHLSDKPTIRPSGSRSIVDECIGDLSPIETAYGRESGRSPFVSGSPV
jgi:hypothetical protein